MLYYRAGVDLDMAKLLKGADVANALNSKIISDVEALKRVGVPPALAMLRVGEKPDDITYEKSVMKRCAATGVAVKSVALRADATQQELIQIISDLNGDDSVHGVLLFRPLPRHIDGSAVCAALDPAKDIDGVTEESLAGVFTGSGKGFAPCTAQACIEFLDYYNICCDGKRAVVVGRSLVVGKPVAVMLMGKNATVTVCHTRTANMPQITRGADIIISAVGKAEFLTKECFSPGQIVIDVGINWNEEEAMLCGDVRFEDAAPVVAAITPVPGGVGTVTTSVLVLHVVEAAKSASASLFS